jgi:hypothetical protein
MSKQRARKGGLVCGGDQDLNYLILQEKKLASKKY